MLLQERDGKVLVLTLDRPESHNAISVDLAEAVARAVEAAGEDESVNVVIIRGSGRSFSAGYDLAAGDAAGADSGAPGYGARSLEDDVEHLQALSRRWSRVLMSPLPVIAQVHGYCLAGGTDLAGHCDLVIVADEARIGFPAVRSMGVALTQMWLYNVGPQWAKRLLLTGDTITGRLAAEIGFAVQSVPAAELERVTRQLAHHMALVAREMLIGNKRVINHGLDLMGREALQAVAARADAAAHQTAAAQEFVERVRVEGLKAALRHRDEPFGSEVLDARP